MEKSMLTYPLESFLFLRFLFLKIFIGVPLIYNVVLVSGIQQKIVLKKFLGTSLAVQRLGLDAFNAMGQGLIPGQVTKNPQPLQHSQTNKQTNSWNYKQL